MTKPRGYVTSGPSNWTLRDESKSPRLALWGPHEVWEACEDFRGVGIEHLIVFVVDSRSRVMKRAVVATGSTNVARASVADVVRPVLMGGGEHMILAHNHPTNEPEPSEDDVMFTRAVQRGADLLGLTLWDHVVVCADGWVSIRGRGLVG